MDYRALNYCYSLTMAEWGLWCKTAGKACRSCFIHDRSG
jgi:hypothetical protein